MTKATKIKVHFGVLLGDEVKTFCGTGAMGAADWQDKYTTETHLMDCLHCFNQIDRVAKYALQHSNRIPKNIRGITFNGTQATW